MSGITRRRSFSVAAMAFVAATALVPTGASASDAARAFIEQAAARARSEAPAVNADGGARQRFAALFAQHFDLDSLISGVMGQRWDGMSATTQGDFRRAFEAYLVKAYAERFYAYAGQPMSIVATEPASGGAVLVRTMVRMPRDGSSVPVDWKVASIGGGQRITDVVIDGVSLIRTQREEFASVIRSNGGDVGKLTAMLNQRAQ